jgi:hypothetical protein
VKGAWENPNAVIPAKAGGALSTPKLVIQIAVSQIKMDSRFRGNDEQKGGIRDSLK